MPLSALEGSQVFPVDPFRFHREQSHSFQCHRIWYAVPDDLQNRSGTAKCILMMRNAGLTAGRDPEKFKLRHCERPSPGSCNSPVAVMCPGEAWKRGECDRSPKNCATCRSSMPCRPLEGQLVRQVNCRNANSRSARRKHTQCPDSPALRMARQACKNCNGIGPGIHSRTSGADFHQEYVQPCTNATPYSATSVKVLEPRPSTITVTSYSPARGAWRIARHIPP